MSHAQSLDETIEHADAQRRRAIARRLSGGLLIFCLLAIPATFPLSTRLLVVPSFVAAAIICATSYALARAGHYWLPSTVLILGPTMIVVAVMLVDGAIGTRPYYLAISVMVASLLLRPAQIWLVLAVNLALLAAAIAALPPEQLGEPLAVEAITGGSVLAALVALAGSVAAGSVRAAMREAQIARYAAESANLRLLDRVARQRAAEQALRASEERFQKAFDRSPVGIALVTIASGQVIEANQRLCEMIGYSREELLGGQAEAATIWADSPVATLLGQRPPEITPVEEIESTYMTRGGDVRQALISIDQIELAGQACMLLICLDITARKRIEAQLIQAQKMEGIGRLAGGIAHDFNNLLTVVSGNIDLARAGLAPGSEAVEDLRHAEDAARRAATLTRQLLAFARRQMLAPRLLSINDLISDISILLRRLIGDDITLTTALGADVGQVRADPAQVEQILVNLIVNARDALPEGGAIWIETGRVELDEEYVRRHPGASVGPHAMLAVRDNGVGMPPEVQSRVFEPFFSTKPAGVGTGLGLATSYGIVKQHGGSIWCLSAPGEGTTFQVFLPLAAEQAPEQPRIGMASAPEAPPASGELVLLAEDNAAVRAFALRVLREAGYRVVAAADGAEALLLAEQEPELGLLVTDMVMPQVGGAELAARLRLRQPDLPVVLISGYDDGLAAASTSGQRFDLLTKPFTAAALLWRAHQALRGLRAREAQ